MTVSMTYLLISGGLLVFFVSFFAIESRRGDRLVFAKVRAWSDVHIVKMQLRYAKISFHIGSGAMRIALHYITHRILGWAMQAAVQFEEYFAQLQRKNRKVVHTIREEQKDEQDKTHLDLIAEHKEATALTEHQKKKVKEKSIGGKL